MATTRILPKELGCAEPYLCSYSARVKLTGTPEEQLAKRQILLSFVNRYQQSCQELVALLKKVLQDPASQPALYTVLLPSKVPEAIKASRWWQENMVGTPDSQGKPIPRHWADPQNPSAGLRIWEGINKAHTTHLLEVLADPTAPAKTRASLTLQQMVKEYGLTCPALQQQAAELHRILNQIPGKEQQKAVGESVAAICKSTLSLQERSRQENGKRQAVIGQLTKEHPAFFEQLAAFVKDTEVWVRGCRTFRELREQTKAELAKAGYDEAARKTILQACQRAAMRNAATTISHWEGLYATSETQNELAAQHPKLVQAFRQACNESPKVEEDQFRRLRSANTPPTKLAEEAYTLERILGFYQKDVKRFSPELETKLAARIQNGKHTEHTGWKKLCKAVFAKEATAEEKELFRFMEKKIRTWFRNIRPIENAGWAEAPAFWPQLAADHYGWSEIEQTDAPSGRNEMNVVLCIPHEGKKARIAVNLRGYLPGGAEKIEQLDVANRAAQYRPNRRTQHEVKHSRSFELHTTYLKLQAMRLVADQEHIKAHITATQMTESVGPLLNPKEIPKKLNPGQRLGVLHLGPGGNVLAHLVLFERTTTHPGWKQISLEEIIPDTRPTVRNKETGVLQPNYVTEPHGEALATRRHVFTQRKQEHLGFVVLEETPHLRQKLELEKHRSQKLLEMENRPKADETLVAEFGRYQANLSKMHYKQTAARVARLCKRNQIGHLLVAGSANLNSWMTNHKGKGVAMKPAARQFFTLTQMGPRKLPRGTLVNAMKRSGVALTITSARAKNTWMKPYVSAKTPGTLEERLAQCTSATNYRLAGNDVVKTGTKRLASEQNNPAGAYPYALNAAWGILLDWADRAFKKHVDQQKEKD